LSYGPGWAIIVASGRHPVNPA